MRYILFLLLLGVANAALAQSPAGWPAYGGNAEGTRFSPLTRITPANVSKLRVAWTYRTGELGQGFKDWSRSAFETTPILYDGVLYLTTTETNVVALNAATGKQIWRFDTHTNRQLHYSDGVSRGVSLWIDPDSAAGAVCHARIFAPTLDSRLLALDAKTGQPCKDFGDKGVVNLLKDIHSTDVPGSGWRNYLVTSPPAILDDKVIVGSSIGDNRAVKEELGIVRAFDARSGKLLWRWDPIPRGPDNPVYKEWKAASASAANAWAPLSVDPEHHLVFVPTGSASPDYYGGERPGDNRWADSVVALNGDTGKFVWGRQLVHHDLWDYDPSAQPTLVRLHHDGKIVPAVIQPTKMGLLFTFDRLTGKPIFPIIEKPVPQDGAAGEHLSPTQPFPTAPPPLSRQGKVTPADAFGIVYFDKLSCARRIRKYRSEGIYTPPSTRDSLIQPGAAGGFNWGGIAFDPGRQLVIGNSMNLPFVVALIKRQHLKKQYRSGDYKGWEFARQTGTPYGMRRIMFQSPLGIPCTRPPWSTLEAVDMIHGTVKWQVPLGDVPFIHANWGMPAIGGPIATASGLIFIGASLDDDFRAFDTQTGKLLWQVKLPAGGQATPMTYSVNGRQYVVIAAGGYKGDSTRGDYVIAYALPKR